jgi:hypothetical protein
LQDNGKEHTFASASEERHRGSSRKAKHPRKKGKEKAGKSCGNKNLIISLQSFPEKSEGIKIHFFLLKSLVKRKRELPLQPLRKRSRKASKKRS